MTEALAPATAMASIAGMAPGWDAHVHVFDAAAPVQPGHYRPVHRPLADIEALAARHGVGRLVLVQPSVYGTDNSVMLQALAREPGRHRGVAVVEPGIDDAALDRLHAAGVRGVRFNLVSPVGHAGDPGDALRALAPRLRAQGWHVQWYVRAADLPRVAAWQAESGLPFVLDHLAGLQAGLHADAPAWHAAQALAAGGAWLKLSGWYRLGATEPYATLYATIEWVASRFGERLVWGSDWPHTGVDPDRLPAYASLGEPVRAVLGDRALQAALTTQAARLYA